MLFEGLNLYSILLHVNISFFEQICKICQNWQRRRVCLPYLLSSFWQCLFEEDLRSNIESKFFQFINVAEHCKVCISFGKMKLCCARPLTGSGVWQRLLYIKEWNCEIFTKYKFYSCSFYDSVSTNFLLGNEFPSFYDNALCW